VHDNLPGSKTIEGRKKKSKLELGIPHEQKHNSQQGEKAQEENDVYGESD
jgi:hypothetical protein